MRHEPGTHHGLPLRQATHGDIAALHRVRVAVRENRLSDPGRITPGDYLEHIERLGRGWVVEGDDGTVAFAVGCRSGSIWALFVHPDQEGRGHGRRLHAAMTGRLWSLGLQRLWLTTAPGSRAERFNRALGWTQYGATPGGELETELRPAPAGPD